MNTPSAYFDGIDTNITSGSGGQKQEVGQYVVHEFTSSATFTPATTARYEFFMVGYGGAGGTTSPTPSTYGGAGGGGGEVVLGSVTLQSGSAYSITFDAASIPNEVSFAGITAYQGGNGGIANASSNANGDDGSTGGTGTGGSGGGGARRDSTIGTGGNSSAENGIVNYLYRYGREGGNAIDGRNGAAGGGGAGSEGGDADPNGTDGGDGGGGISNDWLGTPLVYGGGGGGYPSGQGSGGGGNAATSTNGNATSPRANSGGGGGGVNDPVTPGSNSGAEGIVLIRYRMSV